MNRFTKSAGTLGRGCVLAGLVLVALGCEAVVGLLTPTPIVISLVNTGDFAVEGTFLTSDIQEIPELLLIQIGDATNFSVDAGRTVSFVRDCDDVQALMVEDADLRVLGGIGPEARTGVFRDGDEFGCGDQITLTFSHPASALSLDIASRVE